MRSLWQRYGYILILLAIAVLFVVMQGRNSDSSSGVSLGLAPWKAQISAELRGVGYWWQGITQAQALSKENEKLKTQNQLLFAECERFATLGVENERLSELLRLRQEKYSRGVAARVCDRDPNQWYSLLTIDRGNLDGVYLDGVVLAPSGLVGRVCAVNNHAAQVMLVQNPQMSVPVMLVASGAVGILYGDDALACTMKFIRHDVAIAEGEIVVTSGQGDIYPKGIVVGRVGRNYGRSEALFQSVQVLPLVDFGSLHEVIVLERAHKAPDSRQYMELFGREMEKELREEKAHSKLVEQQDAARRKLEQAAGGETTKENDKVKEKTKKSQSSSKSATKKVESGRKKSIAPSATPRTGSVSLSLPSLRHRSLKHC